LRDLSALCLDTPPFACCVHRDTYVSGDLLHLTNVTTPTCTTRIRWRGLQHPDHHPDHGRTTEVTRRLPARPQRRCSNGREAPRCRTARRGRNHTLPGR